MGKPRYLYTDGQCERTLSEIKKDVKNNGLTIASINKSGIMFEVLDSKLSIIKIYRRSRKWNVRFA